MTLVQRRHLWYTYAYGRNEYFTFRPERREDMKDCSVRNPGEWCSTKFWGMERKCAQPWRNDDVACTASPFQTTEHFPRPPATDLWPDLCKASSASDVTLHTRSSEATLILSPSWAVFYATHINTIELVHIRDKEDGVKKIEHSCVEEKSFQLPAQTPSYTKKQNIPTKNAI